MPEFSVKTTRRSELIDITAQVASVVEASGLAEGVAHVYAQ